MFGFLKKKIKESIDNISKAVSKKPEETPAQPSAEAVKSETFENPAEATSQPNARGEELLPSEAAEEIPLDSESEKENGAKMEAVEIAVGEKPIETAEEKIASENFKETAGDSTAEEKKEGFFQRFTKKLTRQITEVKIGEDDISETIDSLRTGLLESDVALDVAEKICADLEKDLVGKAVKRTKIEEAVKTSLNRSVSEIFSQEKTDLVEFVNGRSKPALIIFTGFNGAGKTTTLARIGHHLQSKGLRCVFAAGDSFRAAGIEQIQVHGDRLGIRVIKHDYGADSAAVIFDAMKYATAHNIDAVLADTAGRTHVNANLMDELKKVCRVNKPAMKILVLDSLTGNDIVQQAQRFDEAIGIDAVVFTKADVYEKGGAILSAAHTIKKPILFLGVGQGYGDLEEFDAKKIVDMLLGK